MAYQLLVWFTAVKPNLALQEPLTCCAYVGMVFSCRSKQTLQEPSTCYASLDLGFSCRAKLDSENLSHAMAWVVQYLNAVILWYCLETVNASFSLPSIHLIYLKELEALT